MEDLKQLFKEENQSASSGEVLNRDNQALKGNLRKKKKMNKSVKAAPQTCPEIDSGTLSESDRVLMSILSFGPPF